MNMDINGNLVKEKAMACSIRGGASHRFAIAVQCILFPPKIKIQAPYM
jgi:hypothetical protein